MKIHKEQEEWMTWLLLFPIISYVFFLFNWTAGDLSADPLYQSLFKGMAGTQITYLFGGCIDTFVLYYCAYKNPGTIYLKLNIFLNYLSVLISVLVTIYYCVYLFKIDLIVFLALLLSHIYLKIAWIKKCNALKTLNIRIRSDAAREVETYRLVIENMEKAKNEVELTDFYRNGVIENPAIGMVLKNLYKQRKKELAIQKDLGSISGQIEMNV